MTSPESQPLLFLGDNRRQAVRARIADALRRWRQSWVRDATDTFDVTVEAPSAEGFAAPVAGAVTHCWALELGAQRLAVLLLPHATFAWAVQSTGPAPHEATSAAEGSLADQLEREVASSLLAEIGVVDRRQPIVVSRLSAHEIGAWSIHARAWTVHARAASARGFSVLVSASRVEMLAPARMATAGGTLEPRRQAIGDNPVAVRGVIGDTSMSVTELAELAVDDVLVLDQALGEPVALVAPDSGRTIAAGSLGRAGPRRAIKLAAITAHNG
jgi:flagellar motor switch/type III secretory pathway protein FliN